MSAGGMRMTPLPNEKIRRRHQSHECARAVYFHAILDRMREGGAEKKWNLYSQLSTYLVSFIMTVS